MASSGYIDAHGVYHKIKKVPLKTIVRTQQTMFKQGDHARQRFDHSAEILQPYDHKGEPNKAFIEAYPDAAIQYGFFPKTDLEKVKESDTPTNSEEFGGSAPWGQQVHSHQMKL